MATRICAMACVAGLAALFATPARALDTTPSQTEGPYYPRRLPAEVDADLTRIGAGPQAKGDVLVLSGTVVDPQAKPITGAVVEVWQADAQGIYRHPRDPRTASHDPAFQSYGRTTTAEGGAFSFRTIVPGRYEGRPPHVHLKITPPGGRTLTTQLYFKGDADLARDGIASALGKALELVTLVPAKAGPDGPLEATVTLVVKRGRGK